jgi:hypothetical protein
MWDLFLVLRGKPDSPPISTMVLECWVNDGDGWTKIKNEDPNWLLKGNVAWYPFRLVRELKPGSTYDVRWFFCGRRRSFADLTRHSFILRTYGQISWPWPPGSARG